MGTKNNYGKRFRAELLIFTAFAAITVFVIWPLLIRAGSSVYGVPNDNIGAIWWLWWLKNYRSFSASVQTCPLIGYPFGAYFSPVPMEPIQYSFYRFSLLFLNEAFVFNLDILLSFLLSGITMYYLVKHITRDRKSAFFGGLAYLIAPYHAYQTMFVGGGIAPVQWMPLYILTLLKYCDKPNAKRALILGISAVLVAGTSVHYALFTGLFTVFFLVGRYSYKYFKRRKYPDSKCKASASFLMSSKRSLLLSLLVVLIVVLFSAPFYTLGLLKSDKKGQWDITTTPSQLRVEEHYVKNSAHPKDYILPTRRNLLWRLLSGATSDVETLDIQKSLYLGLTLIILSGLSVAFAFRKEKQERATFEDSGLLTGDYRTEADFNGKLLFKANLFGFFVAGIASLLFSLKPYFYIGGAKILMPSYAFMIFVPWFRWYLRIGSVVQLCAVVLASVGLYLLLTSIKAKWKNFTLFGL